MSAIHNDLAGWAGKARSHGNDRIDITVDTADEISELIISLSTAADEARSALASRDATIADLRAQLDEAKIASHDSFKLACMWQDQAHAAEARCAELEQAAQLLVEWISLWDRVCDAADPDDGQPPSWEEVRKLVLPDWEEAPSAEYWSAYMEARLVYLVRDFAAASPNREGRDA